MEKFRVVNGSGLYVTDIYANGHILVSARFSEARVFEGDYWKEFWDECFNNVTNLYLVCIELERKITVAFDLIDRIEELL